MPQLMLLDLDKNVYAPGGGVIVTSIQGDTSFNDWIQGWLEIRTRNLNFDECLAIGLSCSTNGASSDCLATALNWPLKPVFRVHCGQATKREGQTPRSFKLFSMQSIIIHLKFFLLQ